MTSKNSKKFLFALIPFLLAGCAETELTYILSAGLGQLNIIARHVDIEDAINDPEASESDKEKLIFIQALRAYAKNTLQMEGEENFSTFYETGQAAVYNLNASPKYALEPLSWTLPLIGTSTYLTYFRSYQATIQQKKLEAENYDVMVYGAVAYSTLGVFTDPVFSPLLDLDKGLLAEVIFHELTHATVFSSNDEFNESIANFIGKTAAMDFIKTTAGVGSDLQISYQQYTEDQTIINEFCCELYNDLREYFSRTDLTNEEKTVGREAIYESARIRYLSEIKPLLNYPDSHEAVENLPTNNAWVLLHHRYNKDTATLEATYQACDQNLATTIQIFKQASYATDCFQFLKNWNNTHSSKISNE